MLLDYYGRESFVAIFLLNKRSNYFAGFCSLRLSGDLVLVGQLLLSALSVLNIPSNNTNQESRRAVVAAVMGAYQSRPPTSTSNQLDFPVYLVAFANSAGLISTNVFRAQDEPRYIPALATSGQSQRFLFIFLARRVLISLPFKPHSVGSASSWSPGRASGCATKTQNGTERRG
jgi:hypothetical protein